MKSFFSLALLLALCDVPSWSQTQLGTPAGETSASGTNVPSLSDIKEAQRLMHTVLLWIKPVDWKEKGSSTNDIADHVRQALGKDVEVEVRGRDKSLSTFELPQAPLGPTLSSIVSLADTKLWVFPGRLLISPETLLTPKENASIQAGTGGEWRQSTIARGGGNWNPYERFQFLAVTFVGTDLKERFTAKGLTPAPLPPPPVVPSRSTLPAAANGTRVYTKAPSIFVRPPLAYALPFSELSPATQEALQILLDVQEQQSKMYWYSAQQPPNVSHPFTPTTPKALDASTIVSFEDRQGSQLQLAIEQVDAQTPEKRTDVGRWYASKPRPPLP